MNYCAKCEGCFYDFLQMIWCEKHAKEYEEWNNAKYYPKKQCECGENEWIDSLLQMTNPPSYPEKKIHRCKFCNKIRIMITKEGNARIYEP